LVIAVHLREGDAGVDACGEAGAPLKPEHLSPARYRAAGAAFMEAIVVILAFVVGLALLNRFEFGRFD